MNANVTEEKRGTLAVLALILGIAGIVISWVPFVNFAGFLVSIAAIVLGAIEITRINQGKSSASGKGFAITGIVLGAVAIVLGIVSTVVLGVVLGITGFFSNLGC